jgi:hypothetical protein
VEAAITLVLDRVAAVTPGAWRRARAGAKARVSVALTLDAYNRGFGLGPALLRRVAELGLALDFDIYDGADDESRRRTRERVGEIGRTLQEGSGLTPLGSGPEGEGTDGRTARAALDDGRTVA